MGLLDSLGGSLRNVAAAAAPMLIAEALKQTNLGNLQGIVNQLQQAGLGAQVQSWLGSSTNLSVTPEQLRAALGNEHVEQLAAKFGVPTDQVLTLLAKHLPTAIDQASPNGVLKS